MAGPPDHEPDEVPGVDLTDDARPAVDLTGDVLEQGEELLRQSRRLIDELDARIEQTGKQPGQD